MSNVATQSAQGNIIADKLQALSVILADTARRVHDGSLSLESNTPERLKIINTARDAIDLVKQASDDVLEWIPALTQLVAVRLFIEWKVFHNMPTGAEAKISYEELAENIGAEAALIARFAAPLIASKFLHQPAPGHLSHTSRSRAYSTPNPLSALAQMLFDDNLPAVCAMPAYFAKFGLKEPTGRLDTITAFASGQLGRSVWEILAGDPRRQHNMMLAMAAMEQKYPSLGEYDFSWAVSAAADDRVVLVDVGGGKGQAIKEILRATPGLRADQCVVEDLPGVVEAAEASASVDTEIASVRFVATDFHAEQPIKEALAYYIRRCLHDYGDEDCVVILKHISDAMAPDSKLLIVEQVLDDPPSGFAAATDVAMMAIGGKERTVDGFKDIVGRAGLNILRVCRNKGTDAALIECGRA